ncbi:tetratricopeptide repeat protein [Novipirellula caenicola]|uniref:Lipoprotein NlpI n=1 Tax=Novipirellula caenicola TaxID=1536901 RepID=A0ABP9VQY3_9BACT
MRVKAVVALVLACLNANFAFALEQGDLVAARRDVSIVQNAKSVDQAGAGQVLKVLQVNGSKILVSRGRPGWLAIEDVVKLDAAEAFFSKPFATGANARDYLSRGTVRMAIGKHAEGIADLKKALKIANSPGDYLEPLAYAQITAQDQPAAIATFTRGIQDDPKSVPAWMGRGLAYYQVGQNQNALDDFTKAIQLDPNHAFSRKYMGALQHDLGNVDSARKQLDLAVKLDPHDGFARKARGRVLYDQTDYAAALEDFSMAVTLDAADGEAVAGRGVVRLAIGDELAAAEADFKAAIELEMYPEENAYLWSNLGQVQTELGKFDEAERNLDRAIELAPKMNEARSHRAYLLATHSPDAARIAAAKADVQSVFASREPRTYWDYRALAAVNAAMGDYARAAKHMTLGEAIVRSTGPVRFVEPTVVLRKSYDQKLTPMP